MKKVVLFICMLICLSILVFLLISTNGSSEYNYKNITKEDYLASGFSAKNQVIKFYNFHLNCYPFETKDSPIEMLKHYENMFERENKELTRFIYDISDSNTVKFYGISMEGTEITDTTDLNWLASRISERIDYYREPEKILEKAGINTQVNDVLYLTTISELFATGPIFREIGIFFECGKTDYVYIMEEYRELVDEENSDHRNYTNYTHSEYVIPHDIYLETIRIFKPWSLFESVRIDEWQQRYNENFKVEEYRVSLVEE